MTQEVSKSVWDRLRTKKTVKYKDNIEKKCFFFNNRVNQYTMIPIFAMMLKSTNLELVASIVWSVT